MNDSQFSGQVVVTTGFIGITQQFIRAAHIQEKGRIKFLNTVICHCVRPVQRNLIPMQPFVRIVLMARHVMGSNAGLVVILCGPPGLLIERPSLLDLPQQFSLRSLQTKLDYGIVWIHICIVV